MSGASVTANAQPMPQTLRETRAGTRLLIGRGHFPPTEADRAEAQAFVAALIEARIEREARARAAVFVAVEDDQ